MNYIINRLRIETNQIAFLYEEEAYSGVNKIADKVRKDVSLVFDAMPERIEYSADACVKYPVVFGTLGKSTNLKRLEEAGIISSEGICNKREVFAFKIADASRVAEALGIEYEKDEESESAALIIMGSDKRGTIYGLFHLSELLGVSALVDWCDCMPDKRSEVIFTEDDNMVSKEPSVKYRGFFINDEWPAFGNWTTKNFGGFNSKMYEHVFELLLRLKGNYMWPAMWSAIFSNDGPELSNAELADELGVIMGLSHHEPCLRHGEEYRYLRGKDSIYGDAWNFRTNEEGITRFWEDGLKRNGKFENVVTVGMRGECDSTIMGKDATLKDNIDLLRDVLKTQNRLIRENVNENLDEVPRMLALYKEVEPFFYGDENTEGLEDSEELEGVTLMLCDDNFGNLRTLPTEHMKEHRGGYGMYYHFDYHGAPVSFEWINSSYLPKVWEQMTQAYENGIRELWIVNVGDIFTNEYPLSFFMNLAYDYDKWGVNNINSPRDYTKKFVNDQFGTSFDEYTKGVITDLLMDYTKILHNRRPEAMNDNVYAPAAYCELEDLSLKIISIMDTADKVSSLCDEKNSFTFFELVGYPLIAGLNQQKLWLATTENHYLAKLQATFEKKVAAEVEARLKLDRAIIEQLHEMKDGKWYGMGMSEHIGFTKWNEEECCFPVIHSLIPSNKTRFVVTIPGTAQHTEGGVWSGKKLVLPDFLNPEACEGRILLYTTSDKDASYEIKCDAPFLSFGSQTKGTCMAEFYEYIFVKLDRAQVKENTTATITIHGEYGDTVVEVPVNIDNGSGLADNTYLWCGEAAVSDELYNAYQYISIEAEHYAAANDTADAGFKVIPDYGKTLSALKVFPIDRAFGENQVAPSIDYRFTVKRAGSYVVALYLAPSNPAAMDNELVYNIGSCAGDKCSELFDGSLHTVNAIPAGFKVVDGNEAWESGALNNIRISESLIHCETGVNTLRIGALSRGFVLEKVVIYEEGSKPANSYLGPAETYRVTVG